MNHLTESRAAARYVGLALAAAAACAALFSTPAQARGTNIFDNVSYSTLMWSLSDPFGFDTLDLLSAVATNHAARIAYLEALGPGGVEEDPVAYPVATNALAVAGAAKSAADAALPKVATNGWEYGAHQAWLLSVPSQPYTIITNAPWALPSITNGMEYGAHQAWLLSVPSQPYTIITNAPWVPYTGATANVNIGNYEMRALTLATGQSLDFHATGLDFRRFGTTIVASIEATGLFDISRISCIGTNQATPPIMAVSTSLCTNVNADYLDGYHASSFATAESVIAATNAAFVALGPGAALGLTALQPPATNNLIDAVTATNIAHAVNETTTIRYAVSNVADVAGYLVLTNMPSTNAVREIVAVNPAADSYVASFISEPFGVAGTVSDGTIDARVHCLVSGGGTITLRAEPYLLDAAGATIYEWEGGTTALVPSVDPDGMLFQTPVPTAYAYTAAARRGLKLKVTAVTGAPTLTISLEGGKQLSLSFPVPSTFFASKSDLMGYVTTASIPGPGCTDLAATNGPTISGATIHYLAYPTTAYTLSVSATAPKFTYAVKVLATNACTLASGLALQGAWTITGTNILTIAPSTGTVWDVYGRGL